MTSLSRASRRLLSPSGMARSLPFIASSLVGVGVVYLLYRRWQQASERHDRNERPAARLNTSQSSSVSVTSMPEPLSSVEATRQTVVATLAERPLPNTAIGQAFAEIIATSQVDQAEVDADGASAATDIESVPQAEATEAASDAETSGAFVGNVHSLVYHPATSEHLPIEEHRRYFASEEDALAAGYHRAAAD